MPSWLSDLTDCLEGLSYSANHAAGFVNARGAIPVVKLYDVPNRVREVTIHGAHCGAAVALAIAQVHSGYDLRHLPRSFSPDGLEDHGQLIEEFYSSTVLCHFRFWLET